MNSILNFFRRNFALKILSMLVLVGGIFALALLFLQKRYALEFLPMSFVLYGLIAFVIVIGFFFWLSVTRPLRDIILQMQALMTGHEYKKFFTKRIDEIGMMAHFFNEITAELEASRTPKNVPVPTPPVVAEVKPVVEASG